MFVYQNITLNQIETRIFYKYFSLQKTKKIVGYPNKSVYLCLRNTESY